VAGVVLVEVGDAIDAKVGSAIRPSGRRPFSPFAMAVGPAGDATRLAGGGTGRAGPFRSIVIINNGTRLGTKRLGLHGAGHILDADGTTGSLEVGGNIRELSYPGRGGTARFKV
jgi:hypothetical protein